MLVFQEVLWFGRMENFRLLVLWEQMSCLDKVVLGEPGNSRCKADGFKRQFLGLAQKMQLWLDILEGLCPPRCPGNGRVPINVEQFLLVQADRMPY